MTEVQYETSRLHNVDLIVITELETKTEARLCQRSNQHSIICIFISEHVHYGRVQVFGMDGMMMSENQRPTELTAYSKNGSSQGKLEHSFPERYAASYVNALNTFLDVLEGL